MVCHIQTSHVHKLGTWQNLPSFAITILNGGGAEKGLIS
jgi:hypothetical protein